MGNCKKCGGTGFIWNPIRLDTQECSDCKGTGNKKAKHRTDIPDLANYITTLKKK